MVPLSYTVDTILLLFTIDGACDGKQDRGALKAKPFLVPNKTSLQSKTTDTTKKRRKNCENKYQIQKKEAGAGLPYIPTVINLSGRPKKKKGQIMLLICFEKEIEEREMKKDNQK